MTLSMNVCRRLLLLCLLASLPLQAALPPRLVGHWQGAWRGEPIHLHLHADGSGRYQGEPIKWQVTYGQLRIERGDISEIFAMKADAETLMIAGGENATLLVLVRIPEAPEDPNE